MGPGDEPRDDTFQLNATFAALSGSSSPKQRWKLSIPIVLWTYCSPMS